MKRLLVLALLCLLAFYAPASATISVTQNQVILQGNGATTVWSFPFPADSINDINVYYTNTSGVIALLSPSSYTIFLNPPSPDNLWSVGGQVTYPLSGSPIPSGASLTIQRILPLQQTTVISNQGNFYPDNVETAIDQTVMQIQQLSARTGSFRGDWQTNVVYNYADLVIDGPNGNDSGNWYMCITANTSGTWNTDLANGDWVLATVASIGNTPLPLSIANGGTGQITAPAALTALGGIGVGSNNTYTAINDFTAGTIRVPTQGGGDNTTKAASTAFVKNAVSLLAPIANPVFTGTATASLFSGPTVGVTNGSSASAGNVGEYLTSSVLSGSAVGLTSNTVSNITSLALTPGDWNVWAQVDFNGNASTTVNNLVGALSLTSTTVPIDNVNGGYSQIPAYGQTPFNYTQPLVLTLPAERVSLSVTTTEYLNAFSVFGTSTEAAYGGIYARRVR